jgi:putative tetratricopeptide repeat-containing domain protein
MKNKSVNIIDTIDDDKFLINKSIENAIQIFREDKFIINKLVFDSIELLASAEEAQRELKSKNFMQSFLGVITGTNNKLRDKISNNLIQSQYLAELTLKKMMEEHLVSLDLIYSINRKINLMRENLSGDINNLYSLIESYVESTNKRINNLEANEKFFKWFLTLPDREFNGCSYIQLDNLSKLVCLARDFFDKTKGNWEDEDLLLLKGALRKLDINPNDEINYLDNILAIYTELDLRYKYFDSLSINHINSETILMMPLIFEKLNKLFYEEQYLVDTYKDISTVKFNEHEILVIILKNYISSRYFINIDKSITIYEFLIELLSNLSYLNQIYDNTSTGSIIDYNQYVEQKISNYAKDLYCKGIEVKSENDLLHAYDYFYKSYENGHLDAIYNLAELLFDNDFELYDSKMAINLCNEGVSRGQYDCAYLLGVAYDYGKGIEVDKDLAEVNYKICIASSQNIQLINNSKYELAGILWKKASNECDMKQVIGLYEDLIYIRNYKAMFSLGYIYYSGDRVKENFDIAMLYFKMSARYNYARAQYYIGLMYYEGKGENCDYQKSLYWYRLASDNGNLCATYKLALMYCNGDGTKRDSGKAIELLKKTYESCDDKSMAAKILYLMGIIYLNRKESDMDIELAKNWMKKSFDAGYKEAKLLIDKL